jgi:hypothetical protein
VRERELLGAGWSADGKSLLVSWHNFERESALLKVTMDGKASVLLRSSNPVVWGAMASPDGRLLAITEAGGPKNLWQVEHFGNPAHIWQEIYHSATPPVLHHCIV